MTAPAPASPPPFGYPGDTRQWVTAANEIAARLANGTYPPGHWLPLNADIAASTGHTPAVIFKALAAAASQGLITRVSGKGSYPGTGPRPPEIPPRLARTTPRHHGPPRPRPARDDLPARLTEDYLTIAQIARILHITKATITRLAGEGAFDGAIRVAGSIRIPARSADAYLATCLITPPGTGQPHAPQCDANHSPVGAEDGRTPPTRTDVPVAALCPSMDGS